MTEDTKGGGGAFTQVTLGSGVTVAGVWKVPQPGGAR
jgi:hypothetical protein